MTRGIILGSALLGVAGLTGCGTSPARPGKSSVAIEMVSIPPGEFVLGDGTGAGFANERPAHRVFVSGFYIGKFEVTQAQWEAVHRWATGQGYEFERPARIHSSARPTHPACDINWYDAIKWCNARSEQEGRRPAYHTDATRSQVYRRGRVDLGPGAVDWAANGYRLPTEAEWEKAARGGLEGQHYPWPGGGTNFAVHLDGSKANFFNSGDPFETDTECPTTPVGYFNGSQRPAGRDMANGYGLYDTCGNVAEWCWDWFDEHWYAWPQASDPDPRGNASGVGRILRGGSWINIDKYCRVAVRYVSEPWYPCHCDGFRVVIGGAGPPPRPR